MTNGNSKAVIAISPTMLGTAALGVLVAVATTWFASQREDSQEVSRLASRLNTLVNTEANFNSRLIAVEGWQREWPSKGELRMDVIQNNRHNTADRERVDLKRQIDELRAQIVQLRIRLGKVD